MFEAKTVPNNKPEILKACPIHWGSVEAVKKTICPPPPCGDNNSAIAIKNQRQISKSLRRPTRHAFEIIKPAQRTVVVSNHPHENRPNQPHFIV
ncbi:jg20811 [Pararge aegeria aegeria]|uniref:Jg20811 protein n=1 Tax=Pararge aegeria aegeria TaxID=348720 RepID=A0A8S4R6I1_9NEOP|nr:jg20811 [Pararge aegeria aegeria]